MQAGGTRRGALRRAGRVEGPRGDGNHCGNADARSGEVSADAARRVSPVPPGVEHQRGVPARDGSVVGRLVLETPGERRGQRQTSAERTVRAVETAGDGRGDGVHRVRSALGEHGDAEFRR